MTNSDNGSQASLLLMVAGAKGAIASTIALSTGLPEAQGLQKLGGLTTADKFDFLGPVEQIQMVGWDKDVRSMAEAVEYHGVLPEAIWGSQTGYLDRMDIRPAPGADLTTERQVAALRKEMQAFRARTPRARAVLINLLPACWDISQSHRLHSLDAMMSEDVQGPPDLAYAIAAVLEGIPVVNFTPNTIELPAICDEAQRRGLPLAGRDGKTGQTYLKVVLASAFKARALTIDGWYSLNILGNEDGKNLMDPDRACGKLQNKTTLLDDILGYQVGEQFGQSTHKVHIDYYPPRGDAKEAWDVIDFSGFLGMPMSLRLNLQGRDSILAAPMAIDMARWVAALHHVGMGGPIAELGFFFKKPVGPHPPLNFQDQLTALDRLESQINAKLDTAG